MGKRCAGGVGYWIRVSLATFLLASFVLNAILPNAFLLIHAATLSSVGSVTPSTNALLFGSSGNVRIDIPKPGIAVRIEVPREFLQGVVSSENDTHFITSNIRNDYYYYNVVDESLHWTYNWQDNASDGPCFKPNFSYYDPNAPYCIEIWNYLNPLPQTFLKPQQYNVTPGAGPSPNPSDWPKRYTFDYNDTVGIDYCQSPNLGKFVFECFSPPKFVLLHDLVAPKLAGLYNFTLSVANRTNILGYPDFVHAWSVNLTVPVSMTYNAGAITGNICDGGSSPLCNPIHAKGIVYAQSVSTQMIVAKAYVNQSLCTVGTCGVFKLTGLAPGNYYVEGSAGVDLDGAAYSLTYLGSQQVPTVVPVSPNLPTGIGQLRLRRAPLFCGVISYEVNGGITTIPSLTGATKLQQAGFKKIIDPPPWLGQNAFELNITVEATDSFGHMFRFRGIASGTSSDSFELVTGTGVNYVGSDPYGTEFAGLPYFDYVSPSGYTLTVKVFVSGYVQHTPATAIVFGPTDSGLPPSCSNQVGVNFSPPTVEMWVGGLISGTLQFCNTQPLQVCQLESPHDAEASLPTGVVTDSLFGGNIVVEAFDKYDIMRGLTVINGTMPNGKTGYKSCNFTDTCASLPFFITGFSEYYNHSLSGTWQEKDFGLSDGVYSVQVYVRGYELASTISISIFNGSDQTVSGYLTRGGAFQVDVSSADNRFGTRAIQARLQWRFLNSTIPVRARVYFYSANGITVGYVEALMEIGSGITNELDVISFTTTDFKVVFAGQNWSLREIWFYGDSPTHVTNDTYTIKAYTLGYVRQFPSGITAPNQLVGFTQGLITLFIGNELDTTIPLFKTPQSFVSTPEYDHVIGQVFSGGLSGAETANLTAGASTLQFNVFGFGSMELSNSGVCNTDVLLIGKMKICGQGHFFYVASDGTQYFDYGLDVGTYTSKVPEFGFTTHFIQPSTHAPVQFADLLLQTGIVVSALQMASIMQGPGSFVSGYNDHPPCLVQLCVAPLSWAQVTAGNYTYSRGVPTVDGTYDGVDALFLPAGIYNVTFSDLQYQSQTWVNFPVGWGNSYPLLPPQVYLCPIGYSC